MCVNVYIPYVIYFVSNYIHIVSIISILLSIDSVKETLRLYGEYRKFQTKLYFKTVPQTEFEFSLYQIY